MARLVVKTAWTITGGRQVPIEDTAIVVEGGRIADLTRSPPTDAETITVPGGIPVPGFINLYNHTVNAPLFRGVVDDFPRSAIGGLLREIDSILRRYPEARMTPVLTHSHEPGFSDPGHRMVGILRDCVSGLSGRIPVPLVSLGGSDAKHWRREGVTPNNMAKPHEWVDVEEYLDVVRAHALAAAAFLAE